VEVPFGDEPAQGLSAFDLSECAGRLRVSARVCRVGADCLVVIWGGTRPHIGAIGIGQSRPSLKDPLDSAATSSVFTLLGHKEDMLAKSMSEELAKRLNANTVVVAGIHWDDLDAGDIRAIEDSCQRLTDRIAASLIP
jgi:gallate decarboxylase subunit D